MKKHLTTGNILLVSFLIFLFSMHFLVRPHFIKRDAVKTINEILNFWVENKLSNAFQYWVDPAKTPPIYNLKSYEILDQSFQKIHGSYLAEFKVNLIFPPNNLTPSGEHLFTLTRKTGNWKVVQFLELK